MLSNYTLLLTFSRECQETNSKKVSIIKKYKIIREQLPKLDLSTKFNDSKCLRLGN
jgi:hypothetical protein